MDPFLSHDINSQKESGDHFLSISDLMSGLVLILCLLVIVFSAQQEKAKQELEQLYLELKMEAKDFKSYQEMKANLERLKIQNDEMRARLLEVEELLKKLRAVRQNIVLGLTEAFKAKNIDAKVDPQTGDVSIRESLLFPSGSYKLTSKGKGFLSNLLGAYSQVVFSKKEYEEAISHIIIEGHASSRGDSAKNMRLSVNRSSEVYQFSRDSLGYHINHPMTKKLLIAGRGEIDAQQSQERASDRKVLFRFRFKVDEQASAALKRLK